MNALEKARNDVTRTLALALLAREDRKRAEKTLFESRRLELQAAVDAQAAALRLAQVKEVS